MPPPEKSEWEKRCDRREQEEVDQLASFAKTQKSEWEKRCDRREQEEVDQLAYFAKTQEATPTSFKRL